MLVVIRIAVFCFTGALLSGCEGPVGPQGEQGVAGPSGLRGEQGIAGADALANIVFIRFDLSLFTPGCRGTENDSWTLNDPRIRPDTYLGFYLVRETANGTHYLPQFSYPGYLWPLLECVEEGAVHYSEPNAETTTLITVLAEIRAAWEEDDSLDLIDAYFAVSVLSN
jgi:hypothetical protein